MEDFIFGTLSTDKSRIAYFANIRGGVAHAHQRFPRDPLPGQAIKIDLTVGPSYPFNQAWVYWTNDGSDPEGTNGNAVNGYVASLKPIDSEWDTFLWGYVRRFRGKIPGQLAGTVVRYRVSAGNDADENLLAYRRREGGESLVTVLNISEQGSLLELDLTESASAFATDPECKLQADEGKKRIALPPFCGIVLK